YLETQKIRVRVAQIKDIKGSIDELAKKTKVFVGIGTQAAVWLGDNVENRQKIKYCMVYDPEGVGLKKEPPIDGLKVEAPLKMQFQLIAEVLPKCQTVGMLYLSKTTNGQKLLKDVKAQLPKNWKLEAIPVEKYETLSDAVSALFSRPIDIVWTYPEASIFNKATVQSMLLHSIWTKIPVFGYSLGFVKSGALFGITLNPELQGKYTGELIHKLLETGECSFSDETVARTYEIVLNDYTAKQFEFSFPQSILEKARYIFNPQNKND
ncbi:MAG: hypothetical protein JW709_10480, partial [Sedimentisphaerales bacterium]|nr:hypothetical protein [Sedimentisphaerales bacterium]